MKEITVKYFLSDEEAERLERITAEYAKKGWVVTPEKLFEDIMCCGSCYHIEHEFKFHEDMLAVIKPEGSLCV